MNKLTLALLLAAAASTAHADVLDLRGKMKEGQYAITFKMEMPGMPQPMTNTVQKCVTKEDIEKNKGDMFKDPKSAGRDTCEIKNVKSSGNMVSYDILCPNEGFSGNTVLTFADNGAKGVTKMKMAEEKVKGMPPGMGNMQMTFDSKYVGACTK